MKKLFGLVRQDACHLMNLQAQIRRFESESGGSLAYVMKCMPIGLAVVGKFLASNADRKHRRIFRPSLIELDEAFQNFLVNFVLVFGGNDVIPRLRVV